MTSLESVKDWCFRNRETGEITIGQPPNALALTVTALLVSRRGLQALGVSGAGGPLDGALMVAETGALAFFGSDELVRGVNPFRRAIGGAALAVCLRRVVAS